MTEKMRKFLSLRSRKAHKNGGTDAASSAPYPLHEPAVDYYSPVAFDDPWRIRNHVQKEREATERREAEQRRRDEEQREAQRQADEQKRRNDIARLEAIKRNEMAQEASRLERLEHIRLSEEAEKARKEAERRENASTGSVRRLRELMRRKYSLDVYIWSKRNIQRANRPLIVERCIESDGILQEIIQIIDKWDEDLFHAEEWRIAEAIKACFIEESQCTLWSDVPPWDPRRDEDLPEYQQ